MPRAFDLPTLPEVPQDAADQVATDARAGLLHVGQTKGAGKGVHGCLDEAGLGPAPEPSTASPWDLSAMLELALSTARQGLGEVGPQEVEIQRRMPTP